MKRAFSRVMPSVRQAAECSTFSRRMSSAVAPSIQHSDLSYRALMRNLRLLKGMRGDKSEFNVYITGVNADEVASAMKRMEPALNFEVVGDCKSADIASLASKKEEEVDSIIVCQPYHTLHSADELAAMRRALNDEDGTVGFIWHRATNQEDWVRAFTDAARTQRSDLASPMPEDQNPPLAWVAGLKPVDFKFKPFKHRKFVDRLRAPVDQLLPALRLLSDARLPASGPSPAYDAGVAAALAHEDTKAGEAALSMDLHAFHTSVVPAKKKD